MVRRVDGPIRICFVCTANLCRSPTALAVARTLVRDAGLDARLDSAGTGDYNVGLPAEERVREEAARRGYDLDDHEGRQFTVADFARFDLVLVMDWHNYQDLLALEPSPAQARKIHYLRDYDAAADDHDVPDPYRRGRRKIAESFDIIEAACRGLVARLAVGEREPAR